MFPIMIYAFTLPRQYVKNDRMAKKTKKEKILAEYHRKLYSLNGSQFTVRSNFPTKPTVNLVYREPALDYSYVLNDLKRIAILTGLAICAQVVLWYVVLRR